MEQCHSKFDIINLPLFRKLSIHELMLMTLMYIDNIFQIFQMLKLNVIVLVLLAMRTV
jgi:hypothetical protein